MQEQQHRSRYQRQRRANVAALVCYTLPMLLLFAAAEEDLFPEDYQWRQAFFTDRVDLAIKSEPQAVSWNLAAAWHEERGWVGVAPHGDCCWNAHGCNAWKQNIVPLVGNMGRDQEPHPLLMERDFEKWTLNEDSYSAYTKSLGKEYFFQSDYRGEVYASTSIKYYPMTDTDWAEVVALVRLDFEKKEFVLEHLFNYPLYRLSFEDHDQPNPHVRMVQKNWGFLEEPATGELLVFLQLMNCHLIFGFNGTKDSVNWKVQECHIPELGRRFADPVMPNGDLRGSGNPVLWKRDDGRADLVGMVHDKRENHKYFYWMVLMNPQTLRVTHVSYGTVLSSNNFKLGGCVQNVFYVSSFHIFKRHKRHIMRIFGGEGDEYTIYSEIQLDRVSWVPFTLKVDPRATEWIKLYT